MNHIDYFSDKNLTFELLGSQSFKLKGLSALPANLRCQVLKYAKYHKEQILFEIKMQNATIQDEKNSTVYCPARCKNSGQCYGVAYFEGSPGKATTCILNQCKWKDNLKQYLGKDRR